MAEDATGASKGLSKEQEEFLKNLEEEFKDRFTEADEEFREIMKNDLPPPPIVLNWYSNSERQRPRPMYHRNYHRQRGSSYYRDNGGGNSNRYNNRYNPFKYRYN